MPDETSKPPRPPRVTEMAHRWIGEVLTDGEVAIDATAGNGHDTAFLAQCVGETGTVHAFDIQREAIQSTSERLTSLDLSSRCHLHHCGHEEILNRLPPNAEGIVGAVIFNCGYLPGGDHQIITKPHTSLRALNAAFQLLRPKGILCAVIYPNHDGGSEEATAIESFFKTPPTHEGNSISPFIRYPLPEDYRTGPIALALVNSGH